LNKKNVNYSILSTSEAAFHPLHQILKKQLYLILSRRAGMVVREKRAGMVTAQRKQN